MGFLKGQVSCQPIISVKAIKGTQSNDLSHKEKLTTQTHKHSSREPRSRVGVNTDDVLTGIVRCEREPTVHCIHLKHISHHKHTYTLLALYRTLLAANNNHTCRLYMPKLHSFNSLFPRTNDLRKQKPER